MSYAPDRKILKKYADSLVNFALGAGQGIKKGDLVWLRGHECTKPLLVELHMAIVKAGGHTILNYLPDIDTKYNIEEDFYLNASSEQLKFFPEKYYRGLVAQADHLINILSETNPRGLSKVPAQKIMEHSHALKPYMDWRDEKENKGKFTWTLALYGTPAMAKEAHLSEKEYWQQIIKGCFLNENDPKKKWRQVFQVLEKYMQKLNAMPISKLRVEGPDADLWIDLGESRRWLGGSGANIPSFEIFTSPDWRGTNGWIRFNQPLYRYGNLVEGIELKFENGRVVKSSAKKNYSILKQMIATPNADKIGEFSMTDKRFSKITKFMAQTLYDENIGGINGNSHIALGKAYLSTYNGNLKYLNNKKRAGLGFNDSSVHTDIISTTSRIITALMKDGSQKIIYKNGSYNF